MNAQTKVKADEPNPNLLIWNAVSKTDPRHTKRVNQRGGFTAISAHYQVMSATAQFGPVGIGWGYDNGEPIITDCVVIIPVTLWHGKRENKFGPIFGGADLFDSRGKADSDAPKKAATDGLTKGLSQLGFNADVFLGRFDDNKYVEQVTREFSGAPTGDGGNGKDAPFPQGPAKNKTELKAMGRDLWRDVLACADASTLDALLDSHKALLDQLQAGLPAWWNGGAHSTGETFEGLGAIIEKLKADFDNINESGVDWRGNVVRAG